MPYELPRDWERTYRLPPELLRCGWSLSGMKSGPRKHPGEWWEFLFYRRHGLALGDDDLPWDDPSLKVKVRRPTMQEALVGAVEEMLERSASLSPAPDYADRYGAFARLHQPYLWTTSSRR